MKSLETTSNLDSPPEETSRLIMLQGVQDLLHPEKFNLQEIEGLLRTDELAAQAMEDWGRYSFWYRGLDNIEPTTELIQNLDDCLRRIFAGSIVRVQTVHDFTEYVLLDRHTVKPHTRNYTKTPAILWNELITAPGMLPEQTIRIIHQDGQQKYQFPHRKWIEI